MSRAVAARPGDSRRSRYGRLRWRCRHCAGSNNPVAHLCTGCRHRRPRA